MVNVIPESAADWSRARLVLIQDGAARLYRIVTAGESVLAAVPSAVDPVAALGRLRHEYGIRARLDPEFALHPIQFVVHNQAPALLLHDPGGRMLGEIFDETRAEPGDVAMPVDAFIRHAVSMTQSLGLAHLAGLVHGALQPASFMLDAAGERAWLTGFSGQESAPEIDKDVLETVIDYAAPEATGRIDRAVDARSDLYSLGCLFHRMLTGEVPFPNLTASGAMHAHLTRRPFEGGQSAQTHARVPEKLKAIVRRLLEKEPAQRYQSAAHLAKDLLDAAEGTAHTHAHVHAFTRQLKLRPSLGVPDSLYGRHVEIDQLLAAARHAALDGGPPLMLVEGPAGIGKTALVQHVRKRLAGAGHEFAAGKCEQADGAAPYASIARALHSLLRHVLGYAPAEFERVQRRLRDALAGDASIVTAVFPELARVLGQFEHQRAVSAHAEKPRFLDAMSKLMNAFTEPGKALVLFLDDLQWADRDTLEVLTHLIGKPGSERVLFIAALRDNEIRADNRLVHVLRDGAHAHRLVLEPLSSHDLEQLIEAMLIGRVQQLRESVDLIGAYTGGNPLFAIQFVRSLVDDSVLEFDEARGEWHSSVAGIAERASSSSLMELLTEKIDALAPSTQDVLRSVALIAKPVPLNMLADAVGSDPAQLEASLRPAMDAALIILDEDLYTFAHDRIRDAVYYGMSLDAREAGHLAMGRRLLDCASYRASSSSLFVVANQLNLAARLVASPEERERFARVNLDAAQRAIGATAYASAMAYLAVAQSFAQGSAAGAPLDALIALRLGECEFLCMEVAAAARRLAAVPSALLPLDHRAELARLRVAMHVTIDESATALDIGLQYVRDEAGIVLARTPTDADIDREFARFKALDGNRSVDELAASPLMSDRRIYIAMDVLTDLAPAAKFLSQRLADLMMLRMSTLSLEHGHCDASCYAYVGLSQIVGERYGDYDTVRRFAELAMRLPAERALTKFQGRVQMCYGAMSLPWTGSATRAREHIEASIALTARLGDVTYLIYSRRHLVTNYLFCGAPLSDVQKVVEEGLPLARQAGFALVIDAFIAQAWVVQALRGVPIDIGLGAPSRDFEHVLDDCLTGRVHRDIAAFSFWTYRLQVAYLFADWPVALQAEQAADATAWASRSFLEMPEFVFYSALLRVALSRRAQGSEREAHLQAARARLATLERWSAHSPENFLGRAALVRAELASTGDEPRFAQSDYEEAIRLADLARMLQLQALARELAARFSAQQHWHAASQGYLHQAWSAYACLGADTRLRALESEFPTMGLASAAPKQFDWTAAQGANVRAFDTQVVLKATQALSSEMSLAKLINVLLDTALQYAGADRATLCLIEDGQLDIVARATYDDGAVTVEIERERASAERIPMSIAYWTQRTCEPVVLGNAIDDANFGRDAYILAVRPRSAMCVPLVKQGSLSGLLYLENRLIADVFTSARLRILEMLSSQAAISLENAKLYHKVESEHQKRVAAERHLREAQGKLERAGRLSVIGELAAYIVHEISQPISAVSACSRAAIRWLNRESPDIDEANSMLEQIALDTQRAVDIVASVRAMVKQSHPKSELTDINDAIREVLRLLSDQLADYQIVVRGNFDTRLDVVADRTLIQQVVINLVMNALEALRGVTARPRLIDIDTLVDASGTLRVTVADTGPGIPGDLSATVFDSLVTSKKSGMGMGLSICKSIVEAHGGEIELVRTGANGTLFRFCIPPVEQELGE
ncbi:trifunctional serine/threonine-protein kinase/ATP-binding protein/sensor histidine kinase [Paraburkholderia tropica]|uniref:trifunctional serine/threonine-protein kinase/ATP-binding protein/sensor histidine kinase n=1 Tax=Paraburkholderia tropica TaxID=92647 RepID=UPI00160DDE8F|nr:AAA family ATPase [Paraburkholderia tropica]MBB3002755.1 putative ATPase/signal transduction histidine kinase [Paraburkholderia tropica]